MLYSYIQSCRKGGKADGQGVQRRRAALSMAKHSIPTAEETAPHGRHETDITRELQRRGPTDHARNRPDTGNAITADQRETLIAWLADADDRPRGSLCRPRRNRPLLLHRC